jgi:hypothetical protein
MTAVEWLIEELERIDNTFEKDSTDYTDSLRYAKDIAEEMEKQQIIESYRQGFRNAYIMNPLSKEQYYNETFKNK